MRGIGDTFGPRPLDLTQVAADGLRGLPPSVGDDAPGHSRWLIPAPLLVLTAVEPSSGLRRRSAQSRELGRESLAEHTGRERPRPVDLLHGLTWHQRRLALRWKSYTRGRAQAASPVGLGPVVTNVIGGDRSLRELILRLVPGGRGESSTFSPPHCSASPGYSPLPQVSRLCYGSAQKKRKGALNCSWLRVPRHGGSLRT